VDLSWQVDDVRTAAGGRPVKEFLDNLSKSAKAKVSAALTMLVQEGNQLAFPKSRALGGGLHEIRVAHPEGPFRVIYCFKPGRRIVLMHAFVKRTQQTPADDLELARKRLPKP
jgi:phage-related protein